MELSGIISDETKTRNGKDFYDYFYTEYNKINQKGYKIVSVQEELTFARNTKIIVSVDQEVISEFILRPDDEFLKYMAENTATSVYKYFKNQEKQAREIIRY